MTMANTEIQIRVAGWVASTPTKTYLKIDGKIGPQSRNAIKRFQRAYGLRVDGIVGPKTEGVLRSLGRRNAFPIHFAADEFKSKDGKGFGGGKVGTPDVVRNVRRLAWKLEALRKKAGDRVTWVNSGFRSVAHNTAIYGASNSQHMYGIAADITVRGITPLRMTNIAKTCGFSGVIKYRTHAHVDSRVEYPYGSRRWYWP